MDLLLILSLVHHAGLPQEPLEEVVATTLVGRRIDLHRKQVGEVLHSSGLAGELLVECVREVMSWVSRNDQNL